ncbi:ATP:cob(I)alamin adenosyltransferase [Pseudosporangium ferrugineum]|uniref:ATP:cob(I)alamin adenosyltransferase n=1 Tax=Pseudosporangium ferrugineum TaxID=439699 RepID=UPI0011B26F15|nr:ATP:cob(I)alamin adenosyltransferase [Pseudosporangium ferrugineum]
MPRNQRPKRIVISKVYTKAGDDGTTTLGDLTRVPKNHLQIVAYADVDEANSAIGAAIAIGRVPDGVADILRKIQNDLFDVGADLSVPFDSTVGTRRLRIDQSYIDRLELGSHQLLDKMTATGWTRCDSVTPSRAMLEVAAAAIRRASTSVSAAAEAEVDVNPLITGYLDQLSIALRNIAVIDCPPA